MERENSQLDTGVPQVVWDASLYLAKWIDENDHCEKSGKTLELGSGTGLLGVFVAKYLQKTNSKAEMVMTDME